MLIISGVLKNGIKGFFAGLAGMAAKQYPCLFRHGG